ncbi:hypothetical protein [Methanococcoides seepicolus]|uniref:Uncharacterized protein n=1 Tax=Methanococcoides seepicolus TaxID=2828780 RepID=A0A9E5DC85_9EURY|nr:hypothetical protein [Methanococcoides seepicolus]MCM1986874.1 hypothetical protein [Methanococcoides seepicolus]
MSERHRSIPFLLKKYSENDYNHILDFAEFYFLSATVMLLELQPVDAERLLYIATEIWPDRQTLFGTNTDYQVIILGIALKVCKESNRNSDSVVGAMEYYTKWYYCPDQPQKYLTSVYKACETVETIIDGKNL